MVIILYTLITKSKNDYVYNLAEEGLLNMLKRWYGESTSEKTRSWAEEFMVVDTCPDCSGHRLRKESLHFKINDAHIGDLTKMDVQVLYDWLVAAEQTLEPRKAQIAHEILKEIKLRLGFLLFPPRIAHLKLRRLQPNKGIQFSPDLEYS